jgi:hypothetical protein
MAEQVNKQWNTNAKLIWSDMTEVRCDFLLPYLGSEVSLTEILTQTTKWTPEKFMNMFSHVFEHKFKCENIKLVDFARVEPRIVSKKLLASCLSTLASKCDNIETLNLDGFFIHEKCKDDLINLCTSLKSTLRKLNLTRCKGIHDDTLPSVLEPLENLQELNLSKTRIIGRFVNKVDAEKFKRLRKLRVNICEHLQDDYLMSLIRKCENLEYFSLVFSDDENSNHEQERVLNTIVEGLPQLRNLEASLNFDKCGEKLVNLKNLTHLTLGGNETLKSLDIARILNGVPTLKYLNVAICSRYLTDEAFTLLPVNAKLEHLNIAGDKKFTDEALNSLTVHFQDSLKELIIALECRFSLDAILKLVESMIDHKLAFLDLSSTRYRHKQIAEFLVKISDLLDTKPRRTKRFRVNCRDLGIDSEAFMKGRNRDEMTLRHNQRAYLIDEDTDEEFIQVSLITYRNIEIEVDTNPFFVGTRDYRLAFLLVVIKHLGYFLA